MKIVIAMDSFKHTLTAEQACEIIAETIAQLIPDAQLVIKPMADGGEGTATAMIKASNGRWIPETVTGPLPDMQIQAGFGWFEKNATAIVEMASASGLELLSREQTNPLETTTYGTGQLIKKAAEYGAKKILLAVGGSATVDGGIGAAAALGWKFLDEYQKQVPLSGKGLELIRKMIAPVNLSLPPVEVLCDVDNPLCGEHGAEKIYAPQKGATPAMVEKLEKGLLNLADLIRKQQNREIDKLPGAGAAGGLAAGAIAFMNAKLVSGIETIIHRSELAEEIISANWVITGEGSFDHQSLRGKVVSGIAKLATLSETRIAVIAGQINISPEEYEKYGIAAAIPCRTNNITLDYALKNPKPLLKIAAEKFAKQFL